jgi:hypothetical protein
MNMETNINFTVFLISFFFFFLAIFAAIALKLRFIVKLHIVLKRSSSCFIVIELFLQELYPLKLSSIYNFFCFLDIFVAAIFAAIVLKFGLLFCSRVTVPVQVSV